MPRLLIVDGYNVIKKSRPLTEKMDESLRSSREALIEAIFRSVLPKSAFDEVMVVFDGQGESPQAMSSALSPRIKVVFSSSRESADDAIRGLLNKMDGRGRIAVVSDDNYVTNSARAWGADCISAREFIGMMDRPAGQGRAPEGKARDKRPQDEKAIDSRTERAVTEELKKIWGVK